MKKIWILAAIVLQTSIGFAQPGQTIPTTDPCDNQKKSEAEIKKCRLKNQQNVPHVTVESAEKKGISTTGPQMGTATTGPGSMPIQTGPASSPNETK